MIDGLYVCCIMSDGEHVQMFAAAAEGYSCTMWHQYHLVTLSVDTERFLLRHRERVAAGATDPQRAAAGPALRVAHREGAGRQAAHRRAARAAARRPLRLHRPAEGQCRRYVLCGVRLAERTSACSLLSRCGDPTASWPRSYWGSQACGGFHNQAASAHRCSA